MTITHEVKRWKGGALFIAKTEDGRVGSVNFDRGYVRSEDSHLPHRLASTPVPHAEDWTCPILGERAYCWGSSMARYPYTSDEDMLELAESWIPEAR